jgi:hypothetical protein
MGIDSTEQHGRGAAEKPKKPEPTDWHFRLIGHGRDIDAGVVNAVDEREAFKRALKMCRKFELPGWSLKCVETGTAQGVVELKRYHDVEVSRVIEKRRV